MESYLYFFISYQTKTEEYDKSFNYISSEENIQKPECIYSIYNIEKEKDIFHYEKIFKIKDDKKDNYCLEFESGDIKYKISFENKGKIFIYDTNIEIGQKLLYDIIWTKIEINKEYDKIFNYFIKALEKIEENKLYDELYKETIELFLEKKGFSLLISLFIKIYQKKDLCNKLIDEFKLMNEKQIDNEQNMDRKAYLKNYITKFNEIEIETEKLIEINKYNSIAFYGIILCYYNYYANEKFISLFEELFKKRKEDIYEILIIYHNNFKQPIKQDSLILNELIKFSITNKEFTKFQIGLKYIKEIETFIDIIQKNKEDIYNKYIKNNYNNKNIENFIIELNDDINFNNNENIFEIINNINSILDFSLEKKIFLLYFPNYFWKNILIKYQETNEDNILICFELRNLFIKYYNLTNKIFEKEKNIKIKSAVDKYYKLDEFAIILNQIIMKFIYNNKNLKSIEKLAYITRYNPYYIEDKYSDKINPEILDLFDLDDINEEFIAHFRRMKFEKIFKENIEEYIINILFKIKSIYKFDDIIKLINIKNIENKNIFFNQLRKKYNIIKKEEIEKLSSTQLKEAIKLLTNLSLINYIYETKNKKFDFINEIINKLNKELKTEIFIEIINLYINKEEINKYVENDENFDFKEMKNFIFDEFVNTVETKDDINNIIKLINCLEGKYTETENENENDNENVIFIEKRIKEKEEIKNEFLNKLFKKNLFTKEDFFSSKESIKILLLEELNKNEKIKINDEEYYDNINQLLSDIKNDIDGNIKKKKFDEFLNNNESFILQRLNLITITIKGFDPKIKLEIMKETKTKLNKILAKLIFVKDNISLYYNEFYKDIIQKLFDFINNCGNKPIMVFKTGSTKELIEKAEDLKEISEKIEKVKKFLLFNIIYEMNSGKKEDINFNESYDILNIIGKLLINFNIEQLNKDYKEIIDKIKIKISNNEQISQNFIQNLIQYYNINNKDLIDDLTILFKSKKFEFDINCIIFFFEFFEKDNKDWNDKISFKDYKNLSDKNFYEIKQKLIDLKNNEIYDYKSNNEYNKIFSCLYQKKEEIEYLFSKNINDINKLKDKIKLTNGTIKLKDIIDTEECIKHFNQLKLIKNNFKIFSYIKNFDSKIISQFQNFAKNFLSIIELETNYNNTSDFYDQIISIIKDELTINISQDKYNIYFYYKEKNKNEKISKEELIELKNKINIKYEKEIDNNDINKQKYEILLFFKKTITNLEIIFDYMKILINEGSSLSIRITIKIKMNTIEYHLNEKTVDFEYIRNFLSDAKDNYNSQLNLIYKEKINLRFLYGKQFRFIIEHLENDFNIDSILKYILNKNNNIIEGNKEIKRNTLDYINDYNLYNQNTFEIISDYIASLFINNKSSLEEHYSQMKILTKKNNNKYKGFYLHKCENNSKEKYIFYLFLDKTGQIPISQNILITSKETSLQEMKSFLHRAILCNYNTLFVIEINDTFTEHQQGIMNTYIDKLLSYKNEIYNKETNANTEKKDIKEYLDTFVVFVYDNENNKIIPFLNEKNKFIVENIEENININLPQSIPDNVIVITSDICGLGKSGKIRKIAKEKNKKYFHFPLGGKLTKKIIFNDLLNLLNEIKKNKNEEISNISIHLDLMETTEKTIMNEFLFSFLITKFYSYDDDIIYIPKEISIYVEIPNCFENYLNKFSLLEIFHKENISLGKKPEFDYSNDIINLFNNILGINSNKEIKEFIQKYIDVEKYSYHQINIFIKIFITQLSKIKSNLKNFENDKKKMIENSVGCAQYFLKEKYFSELKEINNNKNMNNNYLDILPLIYDNDMNSIKFPYPLLFINNKTKTYDELYLSDESEKFTSIEDYLEKFKLKKISSKELTQSRFLCYISEDKDNNYIMTNDNFKKMILLFYRIIANVPVIIIGDTGCGKTTLFMKLNKLLNNNQAKVEIINIHSGITNEHLCQIMEEKNKKAKEIKDNELWLFFDEINTCLSLKLITEIFTNKSFNGNKLNDNIRLIGACRPYLFNTKKNQDEYIYDNNKLIYLVQPLTQSLLYYAFNFGAINENAEKNYIYQIIQELFTKKEKDLHENTKEVISQCQIYMRQNFDSSFASLRDITRFTKLVLFFEEYFIKKNNYEKKNNINENNNKIRSIICSIYICYYIKLKNDILRTNFDIVIRPYILNLINNEKTEGGNIYLIENIKNEEFKKELKEKEEINKFVDILINEENFLIDQIELDKGISKNTILKENIFLLFISIMTQIPLIMIGKSGSGKSLSVQLIIKSMQGKYSSNNFFKLFPKVITTHFQGTNSCKDDDIKNIFNKAQEKVYFYKRTKNNIESPISLIIFEQIDLAEKLENNPLEILNNELDYYEDKEEHICFIGISNYSLDAATMNRGLILYVQNLYEKYNELNFSSYNIAESISSRIKNDKIFETLSKTYFEYKRYLIMIKELVVLKKYINKYPIPKDDTNNIKRDKRLFDYIKYTKEFKYLMKNEEKIKIDFHGNIDFYNLIKATANDISKSGINITDNEKIKIVINNIERNFGGIEYEIDINLDLKLEDIVEKMNFIKYILEDYEEYYENKIINLNSVFLFKKVYNLQCSNNNLKIKQTEINDYNIKNCINNNIKNANSRFLLLGVEQSLISLIYQYIKLENPFKKILILDGSPFIDDNKYEYQIKKIKDIQKEAKENKLIIIENLNEIHSFLYNLYDMNYQTINDNKYSRICLNNFDDELTLVNNDFRIIVIIDKKYMDKNKYDLSFLNKFEKINLSFHKLLDRRLKLISKNLIEDIKLTNTIKKYNDLNYSLEDLLINCRDEEIQGLIYYINKIPNIKDNYNDSEEEILNENILREKMIDKIYKILPQDIIFILRDNNIIKLKYYELKNIFNLKSYINKEENKKYKISIIYTFSIISNLLDEFNFLISDIRSENEFKNTIEEIKTKNNNNDYEKGNYIFIHFEQNNSKYIKFISNYILNNFKRDNYNYIIIIHINRNFKNENNEKICSLLDVNPDINQIFIDNLNSDDSINIKNLLQSDIKNIFENYKNELNLNKEFNKTLENYLKKELDEKDFDNEEIIEYIKDIKDYLYEEDTIKTIIIEMTYKLIDYNLEEKNCKDIIKKIFNDNIINRYTIDIVSLLIEYIKEEIFDRYLKIIFMILEDNNILTTLIKIKRDNYNNIDSNLVEKIIKLYLNEKIFERKKIYSCKFLFNYNIPGFYNIFIFISNYINKNIVSHYINNEKKKRELQKKENKENKKIKELQEIEESFINNIYNQITIDYKFIFEIIGKNLDEIIFKDYITYYLEKYLFNNYNYDIDDIYHKIIELLLQLRFNKENKIIRINNINTTLIKIIWLESNVNYIINILRIIENAKIIFDNNEKKLYKEIESIIFNERKNNIFIKENKEISNDVEQCFYVILLSIFNCIIDSDRIQLKRKEEIYQYYYTIKKISKILLNINEDLYLFLKQMNIIDILYIIELFIKTDNIEKVIEIKEYCRENNFISKNNNSNNDAIFKILYNNFIYDKSTYQNNKYYYEILKYILITKLKQISDMNYTEDILPILKIALENNEIINRINDIFQIILEKYLKFKDNNNNLLITNDILIELIETNLNDNNIVLEETLLYLFEKNSLIYLNKNSTKIEEEPLQILKNSIKFLDNYNNKLSKTATKNKKELYKLFCISYIKVFCFIFVKRYIKSKNKWKDSIKIIIAIKENKLLGKMISIYLYKILYNYLSINIFDKDELINYKLNEFIYTDFNIIKFADNRDLNNMYKIDYKVKTINEENYNDSYKDIEKHIKGKFENIIKEENYNIEKYGIDNLFISTFNSALANILNKKTFINNDFYKHICKPLLEKKEQFSLLLKALELFYDPNTFKTIKNKYDINSINIKSLFFGYRWCLNELFFKNIKGIYYPLYITNKNNINYLQDKFYPGNDSKYNSVYYDIINHFNNKPNEGCYICLCKDWFYHSVYDGFPGKDELFLKCPKCSQKIGIYSNSKNVRIIKRDNYFRIFKNEKEIENIKKDENMRNKLKNINYMTLKEFEEKYIVKNYINEKGIYITDKNNFKKEKIVRFLKPISYRILNYILYTNLFFAKLLTNQNGFDKYLPKGMTWVETLFECWNIIKSELLKYNIYSVENFMNNIFANIFSIINKEESIDNYNSLIKLENKLDKEIQDMIEKFEENISINTEEKNINNNEDKTKTPFINLLIEKYTSEHYDSKEFPFYNYFYYTDYLNEKYIYEKLNYIDSSKYPVLKLYLEYNNNDNMNKDKYILDNFNIFNKALNLISQKYLNNISKENASKIVLNQLEIYKKNKELFDKFIEIYNNIEIKEIYNKEKISNSNTLNNFLLDENDKIGKNYILIYQYIIKLQNERMEHLINMKIKDRFFDINCKYKVNIQQINDNELFTLNLPENISFIDIIFNSSYRKIIDNYPIGYKSYKEYIIDFDAIEEKLTNLLLKSKKLLYENINLFNYEIFNNKVTNMITIFKQRYYYQNIIISDKEAINKLIENKNNIDYYKTIIKDFIELIKYLNNKRKTNKEKENEIKEETKIAEVVDKLKEILSNDFITFFKKEESLIISKTSEIFEHYLKSIFNDIISQIKKYQEKLDEKEIEMVNNYYKKDYLISKKDFSYAIRHFISLVLFLEKDKENKIKLNKNNIIDYLKYPDFWKNDIYTNQKFLDNINELKLMNIKINQIVPLYELLGGDIDNDLINNDIKESIEERNIENIDPFQEPSENDESRDE